MNKIELTWTHQHRVARLTMTSPDNLNAMDEPMASAYRQARHDLEGMTDVRALVISGQGRAFSAGGDLAMLYAKAGKDFATNQREMMEFYWSFLGLLELNIPLVCALRGHSVGAGFCFAAACDLRVADETALFAAPFTRLGLHPGMGGSHFLPRGFGTEVARDLMLTGRRMRAEEARRLGFLSALVPDGGLEQGVQAILDDLLLGAPQATRSLLVSQRQQERAALQSALAREAAEQAHCYARPEFLEGLDALSQKRAPGWV